MHNDIIFYGSATIGERGQLVIPAEARKSLNLAAGDKVLVLGHPGQKVMIVATSEQIEAMTQHMTSGLAMLNKIHPKKKSK